MCWNKDVSLNTFLFSIFALGLIVYNNKYTQYKIESINNLPVIIFILSFVFMQLIEHFIWKNINNPIKNRFYSMLAIGLLFIQPIAASLLITDNNKKYTFLKIYFVFALVYIIHMFPIWKSINTSVSKNGHLIWNWNGSEFRTVIHILWVLFFIYPLFISHNRKIAYVAIGIYLLSAITYYRDKTIGSMWCWLANITLLYFIIKLLLVLPFQEHGICL